MSRYDGLIIPRSYSEYINKTDAATLLQALQLSGVMDNTPTADSNHPVKSGGVAANYGQGKRILFAEDQDLNTVITIGEYYTNTDALANSLVNRPSLSDGKLYGCSMSVHGSTNGKITQIMHTLAGDYLRYTSNNGSTWSAWEKVITLKRGTITATTDVNGNINLPGLVLPKVIIAAYGGNKICTPFVYNSYWVVFCENVGGGKSANTEIVLTYYYTE
jgi:hypothetical protein